MLKTISKKVLFRRLPPPKQTRPEGNTPSRWVRGSLLGFLIVLLLLGGYFFAGSAKPAQNITWGVNFSQMHAQNLGLDWKETYLALLDDLKVKNIKLISQWDFLEPEKGKYDFTDLNWQVSEAEKRNDGILLVIGMKTGRWPECHLPGWALGLNKEEQQNEILDLIKQIVLNYQDSKAIKVWQVENEALFPFGDCPWTDKEFLKKEVAEVKSTDPQKRQVVVSDSGEGSTWITAAEIGDIAGTTMYKKVWFSFYWEKRKLSFLPQKIGFYISYPIPAIFYHRKALYLDKIFGKKVIVVELQAEPWGPTLLYDSPLLEQEKTMNLQQFKNVMKFAKSTGLDTFYLWGGEWWYWMKTKQNQPQIWEEARKLF